MRSTLQGLRLITFAISIGIISIFHLHSANAETTLGEVTPFVACQENSEVNCIESISLTTSAGELIQGVLTQDSFDTEYQAGPFWHAKGRVPVYKFPGMNFAYGTNTVFIRGFYWPDNSEYCAYGRCSFKNETVITYVNPYARGVNNPQFNTDVVFNMIFRVPASFSPTSSNGRARNVKISDLGKMTTPQGREMKRVSTYFTPIHLEQVDGSLPDPTAAIQAVAYEDSPTLWIFGKESDTTTQMGPCVQTGGLDVYSNAVSMDMPRWNSQTQSIDIWTKSPHLTTTGEINIGYIEARIPIAMAKCLWGVSLEGKIEGKISITYDDGSPSSVVTMTGNVNSGDYLLVIAGFHFSAPTFHVVLNNSMIKSESPAPNPAPSQSNKIPTNPAPKSITCIKGNKSVTIKSANPICPKGYKKK